MNQQNWKIFNKSGSFLNSYADTYLPLTFIADNLDATGAAAFAVTDPSNYIIDVEVTNGGWEYPSNTQVKLDFSFGGYSQILTPSEVSIGFKDVSIFNPAPVNSQSIESVVISLTPDVSFLYPSISYSSAVFLQPISQGLVETEHLTIIEESSAGVLIRPYDPINPYLIFRFTDGDPEIKLFEIDEENQLVEWADEVIIDTAEYAEKTGLMINIGFRAETEGVFERRLRVFHKVGNTEYLIYEILVNAESVGPDERFDTLITNFGLPSPKANHTLFKEADINEDLPDWQLLNYKAKHIILEHDKIMPYIGTYKGLINAIKWLGYEDIQVKEWFKNVKDGQKLSLTVPYDAADRTKTLLYFSPDERRNLKKLNQLSLVYCLTRETGQIDQWGNPIVEECYNYNINEIFIKLYALKQWLERWIIGVNARITDITGEGVYFERFRNLVYGTNTIGSEAIFEQSISPDTLDESSELIRGDASIRLTLEELKKMPIEALQVRFKDLLKYCWDPSNGQFSLVDASLYWYDPSTVLVGSTFQFPFIDLFDIQWRASVEKTDAGTIIDKLVTKPLFVYENDLRFYNILDSSSQFYDVSSNLNILLENAILRDPSNDDWTSSKAYEIYPDPSGLGYYWMESSSGLDLFKFNSYVNLIPDTGSVLLYEFDSNYRVPLLSFQNYKFTDASGIVTSLPKKYFLDILDGKIVMDSSIQGSKPWVSDPSSGNIISVEYNLNWNYDTSLDEQMITVNVVYNSSRMPLAVYDPSIYYSIYGSDPYPARVIDNSIYIMTVNHTGDFYIEVFAWDGFNNIYSNKMETLYPVWTKFPRIYVITDNSLYSAPDVSSMSVLEVSTLISENPYPLFDRYIPLQGISLQFDASGSPYIEIPSITYFQDVMEPDSLNRFFNLTERVVSMNNPIITVDPDYQKFYDEDDIRIVQFDKGKYSLIREVSAHIDSISGNDLTISPWPADISINGSAEVYVLNDTYRTTVNAANIGDNLVLDVSGYQFEVGQLAGVIVFDGSTGYSWGSSYRVTNVDGSTHTFDQTIPQFFINNPGKYSIKVKHAFSSYSDMTIPTDYAVEQFNTFKLYLKDSYCQEYFLDNTFVVINVLFDQDYVNQQWYNASDNLINSEFYYHAKPIEIDTSTLVIFKAVYDPSNYMLDQKNIWTVKEHNESNILFRVFNESVPFIFDQIGTYDIQVESYDKYGNLKTQVWEGLVTVV